MTKEAKNKNTKLKLRDTSIYLIGSITVVIALAILFGAPISPLWMLAPLLSPIACILFLAALAIVTALIETCIAVVVLALVIVPISVLAILFGSEEEV